MWMFTKYGFFSIVTAPGVETMALRSRSKQQLETLVKEFGLPNKIIRTPDRDYRYRILIGKEDWIDLATDLADDVDYPNFKSEAAKHDATGQYTDLLHDVWQLAHDFQTTLETANAPAKRNRRKA